MSASFHSLPMSHRALSLSQKYALNIINGVLQNSSYRDAHYVHHWAHAEPVTHGIATVSASYAGMVS